MKQEKPACTPFAKELPELNVTGQEVVRMNRYNSTVFRYQGVNVVATLDFKANMKIEELLNYAMTRPYANCKNGYQSVNIGGELFMGQRDCARRLQPIAQELKGKVVVDFGCNLGGMLHAISSEIKYGVGFDFNSKYINTATAISRINGTQNLDFFVFDLDKENLQLIRNFIPQPVDVCMMLAIAKWVKRWKELVQLCLSMASVLVFETNGSEQVEQVKFLESLCDIKLISGRSIDDPGQHNRKLYLCRKK